jgi:hypothetical protein
VAAAPLAALEGALTADGLTLCAAIRVSAAPVAVACMPDTRPKNGRKNGVTLPA